MQTIDIIIAIFHITFLIRETGIMALFSIVMLFFHSLISIDWLCTLLYVVIVNSVHAHCIYIYINSGQL